MSQQPTTPEEDRERTQDEKVINSIRRRRFWIKELKLPLILGLLMVLAMLAALGFGVFNMIRDLSSNPITCQFAALMSFHMGWSCSCLSLVFVMCSVPVLIDNRLQRLLLKYYELTIELEHRLAQQNHDQHTDHPT